MGLLDLKYKGKLGYLLATVAYEGYRLLKYYRFGETAYLKKGSSTCRVIRLIWKTQIAQRKAAMA
jgi:uncharacterized membrane protein